MKTRHCVTAALGALVIGSVTSTAASAASFTMQDLGQGDQQVSFEGKCGEATCGASDSKQDKAKAQKVKEAKCGEKATSKVKEGRCGEKAKKDKKATKAKEATCGGDKKTKSEAKCGSQH